MRRRKFTLVTDNCRRCGKQVTTGSRSLFGLNSLKEKYGSICSGCMTVDEKEELNLALGRGIARNLGG